MRFKLTLPIIDEKMSALLAKELRWQKIRLSKLRSKQLHELATVLRAIALDGLPKNLVCKKLPHNIGYGIFLHPKAPPIKRGQIIAPYTGHVELVPQNMPGEYLYAFEYLSNIVLNKEEQALFDKTRPFHPRRYYSIQVDAFKTGNFTRYINHSSTPNLEARQFIIPQNSEGLPVTPLIVIYLAKKTILPGQQLLVSYESEDAGYWPILGIKPYPLTPTSFQLNPSLRLISS